MDKHIEKYMIHCSKLEEYIEYFNASALYGFDTESCFTTKELYNHYINKKEYPNNHIGDEVRVYAWGLSNTNNDYVLYGETLEEFINTVIRITNVKFKNNNLTETVVKKIKKKSKLELYVHNLQWDIEFLKYYLLENGFKYYNSYVKDNKKVNTKMKPNSFNIVENNNITYSCKINFGIKQLNYTKKVKGVTRSINDCVIPSIELFDSQKILNFSLGNIAKKVLDLDEKHFKLGGTYDYDAIREEGHILTKHEQKYLYNDVYIVKEFLNQFFIPLNTDAKTASGIAFEKYLSHTYEGKSLYKEFLEDFPDLSGKKYFNMIKDSYRGGWTQANFKYLHKHLKGINGTSIDINSSYPAIINGELQLVEKYFGTPLPYGFPKQYDGYVECDNKHLNLLEIEFDKFYNKDKDNLIGEIQVGQLSSKEFNRNGTDYVHTNIINNNVIGNNGKSPSHRYRLTIWEFELDNILEHTVFENYIINKTLTFKCKNGHFHDSVQIYNTMKIEGKKDKNNVKTNFAKLINNSLYGKLASSFERDERKVIKEKGLCKSVTTDVHYLSDKRYYPAFASAVTAWARTNLRTMLYKIGYNNVLYFDTDSLYTLVPLEELKKQIGESLDHLELGKWDIEKCYSEFKTIGSKKYMVKLHDGDIVRKCAGLPEKARNKIEFDDFELNKTFDGKLMKKKLKGGYALIPTKFKLSAFAL